MASLKPEPSDNIEGETKLVFFGDQTGPKPPGD